MERRDVVIVGSGPAGAATALGLVARAPALAARSVMLEKARHPRDKTCAGGVIPKAVRLLESLGVSLAVPQARVDHAGVTLPGGREGAVDGDDLCRVVRRRELDALLAGTARDRGVELPAEEHVTHVARGGDAERVSAPSSPRCSSAWAPRPRRGRPSRFTRTRVARASRRRTRSSWATRRASTRSWARASRSRSSTVCWPPRRSGGRTRRATGASIRMWRPSSGVRSGGSFAVWTSGRGCSTVRAVDGGFASPRQVVARSGSALPGTTAWTIASRRFDSPTGRLLPGRHGDSTPPPAPEGRDGWAASRDAALARRDSARGGRRRRGGGGPRPAGGCPGGRPWARPPGPPAGGLGKASSPGARAAPRPGTPA